MKNENDRGHIATVFRCVVVCKSTLVKLIG